MSLKKITLPQALPWLLIICGAIGLICAFVISYEKIQLLQNPAYTPSCNLNPVISCGSIMRSEQSHVFGFPNPFIGLVAFPVVIATGVVLLAGAGKLKRWYWLGLQAGTIFGVAFVHWLFFQSVYRIGALCPYCVVVWAVTITTFWYVLLYNIQAKYIVLPAALARTSEFARRHHLDILIVWFLVIAAFILKHFWYYYGQHL
ncbi:MAG TPA: vitamin K epoxide reductase family protein [Nevskiaceae bacterium]|nr:vitamin K epoxide reductase family protein [Nevskiaceae bacterium]